MVGGLLSGRFLLTPFSLHIFKSLLQRFLWYVVSDVLITVVVVVTIALCETRTIFKGGLCARQKFAFAFMLDRAAPHRTAQRSPRARSFQLSFALLPLTCTLAFTLLLPSLVPVP